MEERDYYEVLQLHPSADHAMIVQAYWHLALKYKLEMDRDAFAGHALEELNQAFNILGSPDLRQQYDTAHPRQPSIYSGGSEPETKRVSIEVCFWNLPAWQGMLAAACTIGLAAVALVAGAQPVLVFCLAVATIVAALLMLPTDFLQGGRIPIRKRWKRKLRAVDFEKSTSEILARWRQANWHRDGPSSLMELSRGGYPYQHPDDPPTDP